LTFMLRYTPEELLAVRLYDVTPPRAVPKTIYLKVEYLKNGAF